MWNYEKFKTFWRRGGNWVFFLLSWLIVSAIVSAFEHSWEEEKRTHEEQSKEDVKAMTAALKTMKEKIEDDKVLSDQLGKIMKVIEDPATTRLWEKMDLDLEIALAQHNLVKTVVDILKEEFVRVKAELNEDDKHEKDTASKLIELLSEESTVALFKEHYAEHMKNKVAKKKTEQKECEEKKDAGERCVDYWSLGSSLHFTSTVFLTTGYGAHTPVTALGKAVCILLIIFMVPFFLHCLATTATIINNRLDIFLGLPDKHVDLETEGVETPNKQQRHLVLLKGLLILVGALLVNMIVAVVYHYCTTGWSFGDVLYFEFVRISSVGFGDMIPEDEATLAGAIFKNLLVNIPAQIVTFAIFVRALPVIS